MLDGLPLRKGEVVHSNNKMFAVFRRLGGPRRSQGLRLQHPDSTRLMMGPTRFAWAMSAFAVAIWGKADMTFCTAHVLLLTQSGHDSSSVHPFNVPV